MKKSMFAKIAGVATLAAMSALGTGCIISSDDGSGDRGVFHATWDVNESHNPSACDAVGADKVSFLFTASNRQGFDELFDCFDFAGDTNPLHLNEAYAQAMGEVAKQYPFDPDAFLPLFTDRWSSRF